MHSPSSPLLNSAKDSEIMQRNVKYGLQAKSTTVIYEWNLFDTYYSVQQAVNYLYKPDIPISMCNNKVFL